MKHPFSATVLTAISAVVFCAFDAAAQNRTLSSTGGSSLFSSGASSFGSSLGNRSSVGVVSSLGQSGFGQSSLGQSGFGATGSTDTGFIGRTSADVTNFFGQTFNQQTGQASRQNMTRSNMNRGREANSAQDVRPPLLVKVSLGFEPPTPPRMQVNQITQSRLNGILIGRGLEDLSVSVVDGVAVVAGPVSSPSQRMLIDRLARLEPGVTRVEFQDTPPNALPTPPLQ